MRRLLGVSIDYLPRALALALPAGTIVVLASGKYPHRSLAASQEALVGKVLGSPALVVGLRIVAMYVFAFTLALRARTAEATIDHLMAALEQANMAVVRLSDGLMERHGDSNRTERQR